MRLQPACEFVKKLILKVLLGNSKHLRSHCRRYVRVVFGRKTGKMKRVTEEEAERKEEEETHCIMTCQATLCPFFLARRCADCTCIFPTKGAGNLSYTLHNLPMCCVLPELFEVAFICFISPFSISFPFGTPSSQPTPPVASNMHSSSPPLSLLCRQHVSFLAARPH